MEYEVGALDYICFFLFIIFSITASMWSRLVGEHIHRIKADYIFAKGKVSAFSIMLSLAAGSSGPRAVVGYPAEFYYRGSAMWEILYGVINALPIAAYVFVPMYYHLEITSIYHYLEMRFNSKIVRCIASILYISRTVLLLSVGLYTPCFALASVTEIPHWLSLIVMTTINIFFAVVGGLKVAIHADVIQSCYVICLLSTIFFKGAYSAGGIGQVYTKSRDGGRMNFFVFTGDIKTRVDTLSAWMGQLFITVSIVGCQQTFMQRFVSLNSVDDIKKVLFGVTFLVPFFMSMSWVCGMAIYATYADCDPLKAGIIDKIDRLVPFYVQHELGPIVPGFVGIFTAILFTHILCLTMSNINSLSTVLWEDFLSQLPRHKDLSDSEELHMIKMLAAFIGFSIMILSLAVGLVTGIIEFSMVAFSATAGPLLGIFILAILVPMANGKGTATGAIISTLTIYWMAIGHVTTKLGDNFLPVSTAGCEEMGLQPKNLFFTQDNDAFMGFSNRSKRSLSSEEPFNTLFSITYMYYSVIGCLLTVFIGILVTLITGNKGDEKYDSSLLHPFALSLSKKYPGEKPYFIKN